MKKEKIAYIALFCVIFVGAMMLVTLSSQISSDYSVQVYSFDEGKELKTMNVHVFGRYTYYPFNVNGNARFEGYIEIDKENTLDNVVADVQCKTGSIRYFDEKGNMTLIGTFYDTKRPDKMGKILLSNQNEDCYAVYEKIKSLPKK